MEAKIEEKIAKLCEKHHLTVSTAESCTGGLVAGTLINAPGVSAVYKEGYITYSNEAKQRLLAVSEDTLNAYGAVSHQTAYEMAEGCAKAADSDFAVTTTGIAGPGGGTKQKPVGLVYIGCYAKGSTKTYEKHYSGSRTEIRNQAVTDALALLYHAVLEVCETDGGHL
ncbi:competence damage-inducible protein A [uncultured Roseburia sp.]|uniref:Nicotinamide-nucleotide amidohydrolase family protein n=1 Tax=Brotonthovivens ammoniilytica TaxID=2981725 RepID=A0ABT2TIB3_9FIRM|nr:nicotinamide-nucleotide amidohydrolase family protein [Brotonthovivens ammoniilytica]MCU6761279.1 nicotinamide-nucleotide amidohydrolase family protein [Brotonthovivens ammoniilytica]SCI24184.1 competence damage-inducible protein A [uncultured Roseburia sp.]